MTCMFNRMPENNMKEKIRSKVIWLEVLQNLHKLELILHIGFNFNDQALTRMIKVK